MSKIDKFSDWIDRHWLVSGLVGLLLFTIGGLLLTGLLLIIIYIMHSPIS